MPLPTKVAGRFAEIILSGKFVQPLGQTLRLLIIGYSIGVHSRHCDGFAYGTLASILQFVRAAARDAPAIAEAGPVATAVLFLGLGSPMKITIVALAVFFPVLINTIQGVVGVDRIWSTAGAPSAIAQFASSSTSFCQRLFPRF